MDVTSGGGGSLIRGGEDQHRREHLGASAAHAQHDPVVGLRAIGEPDVAAHVDVEAARLVHAGRPDLRHRIVARDVEAEDLPEARGLCELRGERVTDRDVEKAVGPDGQRGRLRDAADTAHLEERLRARLVERETVVGAREANQRERGDRARRGPARGEGADARGRPTDGDV